MMSTKRTTKFITDIVILANSRIWEPQFFAGYDMPIYTASILIPKKQVKTITAMDHARNSALIDGQLINSKGFLKKAKMNIPIHDGDGPGMDDHFRDCWVINAASLSAPMIWDYRITPISDPKFVRSGCKVRVSLTFYPFADNKRNIAGLGCLLGNIQKACFRDDYDILPDIDYDAFEDEFTRIFLK